MSDSPPTPPAELDEELVRAFESSSPERLRDLAGYLEALAAYRERATVPTDQRETADAPTEPGEDRRRAEPEERTRQTDDVPEDRPDGVPAKASITEKEINDNRYYYWQWREGETVKSKYKGPVDRSE